MDGRVGTWIASLFEQTDSSVVALPDSVLDLTGSVYKFHYDYCSY